ncbi:MAG: leucine-rich repeat domain-containing protein [Planctomycetes bacterium]|nr:leucine-rich repeat domain-containing protein [Planctomycetota bacterium]
MTQMKITIILLWITFFSALGIAEPIVFSDFNLKEAVEWKLGVSDPNMSDISSLTELDASSKGITSLKGIEHANNLKSIDLDNNDISDISELAKLTNLEYLSLGSNKVLEVSALANLTKLTTLNLYANFRIVDIAPLSNLNHLEGLWLNFNKIKDISPLRNLTTLKTLYISENQISNISDIAGLTNLRLLYISNNNIKDISAISEMSKLKILSLDKNPIDDLSVVKNLPNLTKFNNRDVEPGYDPSQDFPFVSVLIWGVLGLLIFIYITILTKRIIQKQKVQPFRTIFQMLKWISVVILSLALSIGLYCQAPWKVLVLILIILCTITIMPKPHRKWIWIGTVIIVLGLVIWVFLLENNKGWQPYSPKEELATLNAKREISPEDNAATIYNNLLEGYDCWNNNLTPSFLDSYQERNTQNGFWKKTDYPKLAQWMEQHETLIESLMEATQKPECYFPSTLSIPNLDSMNRDSALRNWYQLLIRTANNDVSEGNINAAIDKYQASLQIGNHFIQQPQSLSILSAVGCYNRVLQRLNELVVMRELNETQLNKIERIVTNLPEDWHFIWPDAVRSECLKMKNLIGISYEVNSKGKSRFRHIEGNEFQDQIKEMLDIPTENTQPPKWKARVAKASTIFQWFYMPSTAEKAAGVIDDIYEEYYLMASPDYDWDAETDSFSIWDIKLNFRYAMQINLSVQKESFTKTHVFFVENMSKRRACLLLIGLKKHQNNNDNWPETLEQIKTLVSPISYIDPINDDKYSYKSIDSSFMLYSKGLDNIDNNGESVRSYKRKLGEPDDIVFWPPPSHKKTKSSTPFSP